MLMAPVHRRDRAAVDLGKLLRCGASMSAMCAFAVAAPVFAQATQPNQDATTSPTTPAPGTSTAPASGAGTAGSVTPSDDTPATSGAIAPNGSPQQDSASADPTGAGQTANQGAKGDIVVTGIRQSLANAQNIKRNSDTVVDAITAQDIGALPDRSVTEALQRVPGVSIERFAGNNDPDHFSVEGSGVFVRGLNFVRSEFNGRDAFSAGVGGQSLNFADVPAELLGSVEVFKNVTAQNIEGGLAGTVNLNTRKPFDNKGLHFGFDAEGNYGDFEKKWSPTGSFLISDTWDTGIGRIGLLGDVSYSRIRSRADGIQVTNFQTRDGTFAHQAPPATNYVCRNALPSSTNSTSLPASGAAPANCTTTGTGAADGFADLLPVGYAPLGGQFRTQNYDRIRDGQAFAAQWESNDGKELLSLQFLRSHTTNAWNEHTFETAPDLSEYDTYPGGCQQNTDGPGAYPSGNPTSTQRAECRINSDGTFSFGTNGRGNGVVDTTHYQNYTYGSDGLFQKGLITLPGAGWRNAQSGTATTFVPTGGQQQSLSARNVFEENTVKDYGANLKVKLNDHFNAVLDVDYTQSEHNETDFSSLGSTFADEYVDISGALPIVTPMKPLTLSATWAAPNPQLKADTNTQYFQDKNVQFWRAAMDHIEHSTGAEYAVKADFQYNFDSSTFRDLKFGARYADRDQTVRYTAYNWGALSEIWSGNSPVSIAQSPANSEFYSFPDFFRGATPGPVGGYYYNGNLATNYNSAASYFESIAHTWTTTNAANTFTRSDGSTFSAPVGVCDANAIVADPAAATHPGTTVLRGCTPTSTWVPAALRPGVIAGTPYLPSEIQPVDDSTVDAYAQLDFGRDNPLFGNVRLSGNVGVRFASDEITSAGSIGAPTRTALGVVNNQNQLNCTPSAPANAPPGTPLSVPALCLLSPTQYANLQTFANGVTTPEVARNNYHFFLPSLNLKFGISRDLILRLAGSKVLTRPDLANIRDFITFGLDQTSGDLTAQSGNPYLKPATAWQFDASLEWYFARVGSVTFDAFYKSIHNFFYSALLPEAISNNGVTLDALVRTPANYSGYGKVKGFEFDYQQTFDFLPSFLSGLGFNGNYTFIDSSGLPNSFLNGGGAESTSTVPKGNLPLEGLSRHNLNGEIFYEKGPISLRAAYNWRSKYLLTATDVIFPYYSIFQGAGGQLDASAFINLNKYVKIGVQGVNLANQITKTLQAYTGDPNVLAPRSYFVNDRRFSFILRGQF